MPGSEPRTATGQRLRRWLDMTKAHPSKWSGKVTRESHALDLREGVFKLPSAKAIARSLKHSAERSLHRKSSPLRSALSMLTFYVNRAGKNLSDARRHTLDAAKDERHALFERRKSTPRRTSAKRVASSRKARPVSPARGAAKASHRKARKTAKR